MAVDVSVVVPVYNTEKYLPECIESLIHQTLKNVEFIFVDDGSTDHSVEIIEKYQQQDNRIHLIKQKNQYAGVARNNGMKQATGKYIIFLDSDDFFKLNMLEEAFNSGEKNHAEIVVFGAYMYNQLRGTLSRRYMGIHSNTCVSFEQLGEKFLQSYYNEPWNKLFLRSFIQENGLQFQNLRKSNDVFFTHMAGYLAKRVLFIRQYFVFYRTHNESSLQGKINCDRTAFIFSARAVKQELCRREMFDGQYKTSYCKNVCDFLRYFGCLQGELESAKEYFLTLKQALIPDLFDSEYDFEHDVWVSQVYRCSSFEEYLWYRTCSLQSTISTEYVSKKSKDYKIGHSVLVVPRKIKQDLEQQLVKTVIDQSRDSSPD